MNLKATVVQKQNHKIYLELEVVPLFLNSLNNNLFHLAESQCSHYIKHLLLVITYFGGGFICSCLVTKIFPAWFEERCNTQSESTEKVLLKIIG